MFKFNIDFRWEEFCFLISFNCFATESIHMRQQKSGSTNNIASLMGVHYQQLVPRTAKVTQLGGTKKLLRRLGLKERAECYLIDSSGPVKLTLWESLIQEVKDGKTYTFKDLRVLK